VKTIDASGLTLDWDARDYARPDGARRALTDEDLLHSVVDAFRVDPRLQTSKPIVAVRNGLVTLSGTAFDLGARNAAEENAANTVGVVAVKNALALDGAGGVDDRTIASEVLEAMRRDPVLSTRAPRVTVENGGVTLNGVASSLALRERATTIASAQPGVQSVTNAIEVVAAPTARADADVAAEIRRRLAQAVFTTPNRVAVQVSRGVVTLSGPVSSWPEWHTAVQAAVHSGARSIVNRLVIATPPR
jgi:osmotically-inducible protein OsmY